MKIKKKSGQIVPFDNTKLITSLVNSGASVTDAKKILQEIQPQLYNGIPSNKVYALAFRKLKSISKANAARYSLKNGIFELGPTGFYFEKFISRIFELQGYEVITNVFLEGRCVSHEVDILVKKNMYLGMVECKFHSSQDAKTDVKVPMYILSRFNDLNKKAVDVFQKEEIISTCWLVTNSKFTTEAIKFAECSGLKLLSWDYPFQAGIKDVVNHYKVYPITCLTTLTAAEKELLLLQDILTVYDLMHFQNSFHKLKISENRMKRIKEESNQLLNR
ncbi:restriction endonuclease [Flavobacterium sp. NRK F7]|uniref:restriction endonuclease n=1 Tax=Flavobacterium sp. NRK F7 TaxID=2954930 RepID=UPI002091930C|nr:restriction endonuclease [Flavobacterium sp. NRK F7]MCO6162360.1 restriction endonuclease [Flavobacterium sp. NRK F7]